MMTRPWLLAATLVGVVASGMAISNGATWGIVPLFAFGALAWFVSRCPHRYATLLPPVRDGGPERDHARWYCDGCGRTWDADVETTTRPRVIYNGYDEQKAVQAAIRADTLDKQRRRMATQRAGIGSGRQRVQKPVTLPGPRPLENLLEHRAVGFADDARPFATARRARK